MVFQDNTHPQAPSPSATSWNSLIESPPDTSPNKNRKNKSYDNIDDRPDDDNNNDDDNDVDCFPRQDKQLVLQQQDISPTAPTTTDTSPSLIEFPTTDKSTDPTDNNNNNNNDPSDDDDDDDDDDDVDCFTWQDTPPASSKRQWSPLILFPAYKHNPTQAPRKPTTKRTRTKQSAYRGFKTKTKTKTKPTHTVVPKAPLLVWDVTQYQLNYNHNYWPISVWDGTTHTDIVYVDDYDCRTDYDYAYGDSSNMNDPSVRLQFTHCLNTVQF